MRITVFLLLITAFTHALAQSESSLRDIENDVFNTSTCEIGDYLNYEIANYTQTRTFNFCGFGQKIERYGSRFRITFIYRDDAWHRDAFVYDINTEMLSKSEYLFYNKEYDSTRGYFTTDTAYHVKFVDKTNMTFIDTMSILYNDTLYTIYKFKTTHSVEDSNDVCMLHFISPELGLITRQSNIWWCVHANPFVEPDDLGYCPFEDRNHFSLLNISNQFIELENDGKKVKEERPDWIIRELRIGDPVDSEILNFYNDTVACNCSYDALFGGYYEYLAKKKPNVGLTRKQIRKIGRRDMLYFLFHNRRERKGNVDEERDVIR
ncbi:MAG: hypothetical protein RL632_2279 [Bacteroidota bacterium]|jgi:hypothetical protein